MITVQHEISFLGIFTLSDAHMHRLELRYVFDIIFMWCIKFEKSVHSLILAVYFKMCIAAPRV